MRSVTFTVLGDAVTKGSMTAFVPKGWTRAVVTHDSRRTKPWQDAVQAAAAAAWDGDPVPLGHPCMVVCRFFLRRPKSVKAAIPAPAGARNDGDKLTRLVWDALTKAGIYADDGQVTLWAGSKAYASGPADPLGADGKPRAEVTVSELGSGVGAAPYNPALIV